MGKSTQTHNQGFTLIELSIVLVIIGLIVGGVLVGQDLIKAAEIRATVGQVEKYNTAVNTFRNKFNGIPGDIVQTQAAAFGLFTLSTAAPSTGQGDGNGLVEGGASGGVTGIGENITFWRHLSDASLIDGAFGSVGNSALVPGTGATSADVTNVAQSLPPAKVGRGNYFIAYSPTADTATFTPGGTNFFELLPVLGIAAADGAYTPGSSGITPIEAYNIDTKVDDGQPYTGVVLARGIGGVNTMATTATASAPATCVVGATATSAASTYNRVLATGGTDPSCAQRFRFN